jgi:hypothetical protein
LTDPFPDGDRLDTPDRPEDLEIHSGYANTGPCDSTQSPNVMSVELCYTA